MSEQRKAVIKNADMSEEMQQDAVDIASQALAKYNIEKVSRRSTFVFFVCGRGPPLLHCRSTEWGCGQSNSIAHVFAQCVWMRHCYV